MNVGPHLTPHTTHNTTPHVDLRAPRKKHSALCAKRRGAPAQPREASKHDSTAKCNFKMISLPIKLF